MIFYMSRRLRQSLIAGTAMLSALVLVSAESLAQQQARPMQVADIAAELNLTAEQTPVFTEIMESHIAETKALLTKHGVDPSQGRPSRQTMRALRGEMQQNREELVLELATVLTPEQVQQLKAMTPQRPRR